MNLPTILEAQKLLEEHVQDTYQLLHAKMVATAMRGYATHYGEDPELWYITGLLHDVDFYEYPTQHPAISLQWFADREYPDQMIHAVEAHAYGYNGFTTEPQTAIASALIACDEMSGLFYAYQKLNPIPYAEMKASSIMKRFKDKGFAPKIERNDILYGCEKLGVTIEDHIDNMIRFLGSLDSGASL